MKILPNGKFISGGEILDGYDIMIENTDLRIPKEQNPFTVDRITCVILKSMSVIQE